MDELTEQQKHLQSVIEQQTQISQESQKINATLTKNREMFMKLQGAREYLEQIGVTLPDPVAEEEVETVTPEVTSAE